MNQRKCCITCNKPLIAFQSHYLHADEPCSGLRDFIYLEANIEDEFLHEKFEKLYGKPELNDYERIGLLEKEIEDLMIQIEVKDRALNKPIIKIIKKIIGGDER